MWDVSEVAKTVNLNKYVICTYSFVVDVDAKAVLYLVVAWGQALCVVDCMMRLAGQCSR